MSLTLGALALAAAAAAEPAAPVGEAAAQRQFDALVREIGDLRETLDSLQKRERGLLNDLDSCHVESELSARELDRVRLEKARLGASHLRTQHEASRSREEARLGEDRLARQLREMYMMGRSEEMAWLLAMDDPGELIRGMTYLDALAARQSVAVDDLRRSRAVVEAHEKNLRAEISGIAALEQREIARAADLEASRSRAAELVAGIRGQKETHLEAIAEMTAAAEQLEAAIVAGTQDLSAMPQMDVSRLRGALAWPVEGQVVEGFGDRVHPRFGTKTPHPGIDIQAAPHSPIRAVLAGQVVFARRFPGFGNTILLDHGGGQLTVYARAAVLNVEEGQVVAQDDILGSCGQFGPDGGEPTVYFELRREGKAVDPMHWLKKSTQHRREG